MKQEPICFPFPCTKSVLHGLVEYYEISKKYNNWNKDSAIRLNLN